MVMLMAMLILDFSFDVYFVVDVHVPVHIDDDVHVFGKSQHSNRRKLLMLMLIITTTVLGGDWRWCLKQT